MKYYSVHCSTELNAARNLKLSQYIEVSDNSEISDVESIYKHSNKWLKSVDAFYLSTSLITEEQYNSYVQYLNYCKGLDEKEAALQIEHNIFPTKELAIEFADESKPVRVGYWNYHNVHKMNEKRELSFVYHYYADRLGNFFED